MFRSRVKSGTPTRLSSCLIRELTADWVRYRFSAACPKCLVRETSRNVRSKSVFMASQSNIFIDITNFFDFTAHSTQKILLRLHEGPLQLLIDMEKPISFISERPFHGEKRHFPYGLGRSGEFSVRQSELLQNHGWAYLELAQGIREPTTNEEERFVEVFSGELAAHSDQVSPKTRSSSHDPFRRSKHQSRAAAPRYTSGPAAASP